MKLRSIVISALILTALLCGCGKDDSMRPIEGCAPISFSAGLVTHTTKAYKPDDPTILFTVGNEASLFGSRIKNDITE